MANGPRRAHTESGFEATQNSIAVKITLNSTIPPDGAPPAESQLSLPQHPVAILGSWDVAQYYLFAATLYVLDGDLFTRKLVNCGLFRPFWMPSRDR